MYTQVGLPKFFAFFCIEILGIVYAKIGELSITYYLGNVAQFFCL
jgi:hypothetical protein